MNPIILPIPEDLSIPELMARFSTEEKALAVLESIRWKDGVVCPHCGNSDQVRFWKRTASKTTKVRAGMRQCAECQGQFRVTIGTIFEDSHIPLNLWLIAWYLMCGAKKGISAKQMQRHLGLGSYKSAWFLCHRIRHAMKDAAFTDKLSGTVEVDEAFVGGKESRKSAGKGWGNKGIIVSLVERETGRKRTVHIDRLTASNLGAAVAEHGAAGSVVNTDRSYKFRKVLAIDYKHRTVNHGREEFSRKEEDGSTVSTNYCESSFSLLKRGVVGSFHHVSKQHLGLYLAEFDFRWNHRRSTDSQRTVQD